MAVLVRVLIIVHQDYFLNCFIASSLTFFLFSCNLFSKKLLKTNKTILFLFLKSFNSYPLPIGQSLAFLGWHKYLFVILTFLIFSFISCHCSSDTLSICHNELLRMYLLGLHFPRSPTFVHAVTSV